MKQDYGDLGNYELTMLELRWEEEHPDEDPPTDYAGWKAYYESLPDDSEVFRVPIDGLQIRDGEVKRCMRCDGEVSFVAIYGLNNEYLGDGFTCPRCAQVRIVKR